MASVVGRCQSCHPPWTPSTHPQQSATQAMSEPWQLTATEALTAFRERRLTPVDLVESVIARIDQTDPVLNAYCFRDDRAARERAARSAKRWSRGEPRGALDGLPVSVKDLVAVRGMPTRHGSKATSEEPAKIDSPVIANLVAAGAIVIGKTTTPEFGHKGVTESPLTGVTRNPWNTGMTPGGSSGGAGAALAAGAGALAIGTDGGGSCRKPANYCGVVGMKPSYGRVPLGAPDGAWPLSSPGPMARSVADVALLLGAMSIPAVVDPFTLPALRPFDGNTASLAGLRVACTLTLAGANARRPISRGAEEQFSVFEQLGAKVDLAEPPIENPLPFYRTLLDSGSASHVAEWSDAQLAIADPTFREGVERGRRLSAVDLRDAFTMRGRLAAQMASFFTEYDLLVLPCNPTTAYEIGPREPDKTPEDTWPATVCFTAPFNITGQPAITVPCGHTGSGLPYGIQIVGPYGRDDLVLRAAAAFESTTGLRNQMAPL
jgi:aspartyl-tRNA(Asn)/glutamyl-tRNA(Gln) amidotransferase subunit A